MQGDGGNDDVTACALDGGASKYIQKEKGGEVMVAERQAWNDIAQSSTATRPSIGMTLVSLTLYLFS